MVESADANGNERRGVRSNSMWSLWYGAIGGITLAYLVARSARRYLAYMSLSWPPEPPPREWELHLTIAGTALAAVLIPPFLAASFFKVGNFANDGYKLGWDSECQSSEPDSGAMATFWKHAGPTAPALHVLASLCLLLPKLLLEARLLEAGFLPKESACKTDLSFLAPQYLAPTQRQTINSTKRTTEASFLDSQIFEALDPSIWSSPFSAEFLQYGAALLVYSSRHSAVFWRCGRKFSIGFALQQACSTIQSCLLLSVCSLLYKHASLPPPAARYLSAPLPAAPVLLGRGAVLLLTVASLMLLMTSGTALYVHGLNRLDDVVRKKRECSAVTFRRSPSRTCSGCGSICYFLILLSLGSCLSPLLSSLLYVHCPIIQSFPNSLSILITVLLVLWIPLWLLLRTFSLNFFAGDALLQAYRHYGAGDAVLVLGGKRAYTVTGAGPKAAIMAVVKDSSQGGVRDSTDDLLAGQVYWLRETSEAPRRDRKISFGDTVCTEETERTGAVMFEEIDDGDYATLMKLPSPPPELMDPDDRRAISQQDNSESTLRRTDSGVPHDEISPCSDSEDTEPPPPDTSEGSSSGVTSAASSVNKQAAQALTEQLALGASTSAASVEPDTVVIRRKNPAAVRIQSASGIPPPTEEPFGRSTNMRMTSFAEGRIRTLPYFPAQRAAATSQHCSTMPAQPHTSHVIPAHLAPTKVPFISAQNTHIQNRMSNYMPVNISGLLPGHHLGQLPEHLPGDIPGNVQGYLTSVVPGHIPGSYVPGNPHLPGHLSGNLSGHRSFSPRLLQYEATSNRAMQPTCISEQV